MVCIAVESAFEPAFPARVVPIELEGRLSSFELMSRLGAVHPEHNFSLVIGADLVDALYSWHEGERLVKEAQFIVLPRPGFDDPAELVRRAIPEQWQGNFINLACAIGGYDSRSKSPPPPPLGLWRQQSSSLSVSSSEIRVRLASRRDCFDITMLVPRPVISYIKRNALYL